mmetsp:Transcript_2093/g.6307  ORF Transcript_2093/g.6307 Transcript_2093/m.6307 type:complete len:322 (-) Transcript_2093:589-1554(-)
MPVRRQRCQLFINLPSRQPVQQPLRVHRLEVQEVGTVPRGAAEHQLRCIDVLAGERQGSLPARVAHSELCKLALGDEALQVLHVHAQPVAKADALKVPDEVLELRRDIVRSLVVLSRRGSREGGGHGALAQGPEQRLHVGGRLLEREVQVPLVREEARQRVVVVGEVLREAVELLLRHVPALVQEDLRGRPPLVRPHALQVPAEPLGHGLLGQLRELPGQQASEPRPAVLHELVHAAGVLPQREGAEEPVQQVLEPQRVLGLRQVLRLQPRQEAERLHVLGQRGREGLQRQEEGALVHGRQVALAEGLRGLPALGHQRGLW